MCLAFSDKALVPGSLEDTQRHPIGPRFGCTGRRFGGFCGLPAGHVGGFISVLSLGESGRSLLAAKPCASPINRSCCLSALP